MRHYAGILVAIIMLGLASNVEAGRYFEQSEIATYSVPNSATGDTFYVDGTNGSDSYNGLSPTFTSGTTGPFKTFAKCFDRYRSNYVVGGDVVKIKAGIYRESLSLTFNATQISSLTAASPLVIGPYGDGEVIIDPSSTPQTWTAYDGNIFWADWPNTTRNPQAVILGGSFKACRDKQTLAELTRYGHWFFDTATRRIYIHTGGINPTTLDPVITFNYDSAEQYAVKSGGYSYLHFYGLTMRGAARYGFTDYPGGVGTKLENCTIKWNNSTGARFFGTYGVARKNHVWGNMLYNWPRGRRYAANGGWGQGLTVGGYGLAEGNVVHDNGGEGIGVYGGTGHVIFQDNISYDNWSVGLYMDNAGYCTFQRNLVYAHNPDVTDIVEPWQLPAWIITAGAATITAETNKIIGRLRQEGIMVGDETATNPVAQSIGFKALNNIIIGARRGITTYGQASGAGLNNYTIAGNTIIMPNVAPIYGSFAGMTLYASSNNTNSVIKNNIIYSYAPAGQTQPLVNFGSTSAMSGVDFNNNLYFSLNSSTPFKSGVYPNEVEYDFAGWQAYVPTGYDTESIYADPQFIGTVGGFTAADYLLSAGSRAINAGAAISGITADFNGFERVGTVDVGALEYDSVNVAITPPVDTPPVVTAFTIPASNSSLNVPITMFTATDDQGVTGYLVTQNATAPAVTASGWTSVAPTSYIFSDAGPKTLYAWARDAAGNVSASRNASISIVLPDTTAPTVTAFVAPSSSNALAVSGLIFSATDNISVTGYMLTETATAPISSATGWVSTSPTSYTFATAGNKTLYAWAKDAAGNVSPSVTANIIITLPDVTAPVVTALSMPATATALTVAISAVTATDNVGVVGYLVSESSSVPAASATGWSASVPASFTFSSAGSKTVYAWAKDAAGNVSNGVSQVVVITLPDTTAPLVSLSAPVNGATVSGTAAVNATASDDVAVTKVEFYVNGSLVATDISAPYSFSWNTTAVANGVYNITAKAYDAANNEAITSATTVSVNNPVIDTTAPSVSLSAPANGATVSGTVAVNATASDNVAVTKVEFYVNGILAAADTSYPYSYSWNTTTVANNNYTLTAKAYDAANNSVTSYAVTVVVANPVADTTVPVVTISVAPSMTAETNLQLTGSATDNVGVTAVTVKVGSSAATLATVAGNVWSCNVSGLVVGSNPVVVTAIDAKGNAATATTTITVYRRGDVNGDGIVNSYDAYLAQKIAVGKKRATAEQLLRGDVAPLVNNNPQPNGIIDTGDVIVIQNIAVGNITL